MTDDEFEWNDDKARRNAAEHGVPFEFARQVFRDPFGLDYLDDRFDYGEERSIRIGTVQGVILFVCYTERDTRKRIISARRAEWQECDEYYRQNP
jgi:uncharacterized DUF497 family protein